VKSKTTAVDTVTMTIHKPMRPGYHWRRTFRQALTSTIPHRHQLVTPWG
jgi:hypothetical protein